MKKVKKQSREKYNFDKRKRGPKVNKRYFFAPEHPQSETHWQIKRENIHVPAFTKQPSNPDTNKEKFQQCMLVLFKPFTCYEDIYDGISWESSYESFIDDLAKCKDLTKLNYIDNICEFHKGIDEKKERLLDMQNDETLAAIVDPDPDPSDDLEDPNNVIEPVEKELDPQTTAALDVIKNTRWLHESVANQPTITPTFDNNRCLPSTPKTWENEIKKQKEDKMNDLNSAPNEIDQHIPTPAELMSTLNDNSNVTLSVEPIETTDERDLDQIADDIAEQFTLNKKQKVSFENGIKNVIKRERNEETTQIIMYTAGPGGTGKSQIIKAIVSFHEAINARHKIKLASNIGTAAKIIGGSTIASMFKFGRNNNAKATKNSQLEAAFKHTKTIIIDEVSNVSQIQLPNISEKLTTATKANATIPFGGIDMLFFGDFLQFPPITGTPLYSRWDKGPDPKADKPVIFKKKLWSWNIWRNLTHVVLLDEQHRIEDQQYRDILDSLREGKCTDDYIKILNSRVLENDANDTSLSENPIIVPGNELRMSINNLFAHENSQNKTTFLTTAIYTQDKGTNLCSQNLVNFVKNMSNTQTDQIPGQLRMYVGMSVYLTKNMAVELGLTNGTEGIIKSIHLRNANVTEDSDVDVYRVNFDPETDYIIVEFKDISMMAPLPGLLVNQIPITPMTGNFRVNYPKGQKDNSGKNLKFVSVKIEHFPLVPKFAVTAHKSQGMTLDQAFVDLNPVSKKPVEINFAYVPLSRVRRLQDIHILRPFPVDVLKAQLNPSCEAMLEEFKSKDLCKDM